jgi:NAD(P)-dependent dehydrogenase (short-subunit alcohol dehydrogenase family)
MSEKGGEMDGSKRFLGRNAVVIGGNSGIGLAVAREFAREGARVLISGRDSVTLQAAAEAIGFGALARCSDVRSLREISSLFAEIRANLARIDVLFLNAGIGVARQIEQVSEGEWDNVLDTNVKGVFFCVKAALPLMDRGSAVVLTGSIAARLGEPTGSIYAASKAALRALGRSFAAELVDRGIRVNVVSPGPVETPLFDRVEGVESTEVPAMRQSMIDRAPMKRLGLPKEVAAAVLFLCSDAASYITGIDLIVAGGRGSF